MDEGMNLECKEPALGRSTEIGSVLAQKLHSTVPNRQAEGNWQRVDHIEPL